MDSGTENLDATARVVRRIVTFTQAGGVIHIIVQGVNVGAQSYFDALATMLQHTRGVLIMTPGASMVLTGRAALEASGSVAAVRTQLSGAAMVHLACHGRFRTDNPLFSALEFGDGWFTVYEFERLDSAPGVVVLSACDAGLSAERPGNEVMGIVAGLLGAGTRTVIASIGLVPDAESTRTLMVDFHSRLAAGSSPAGALAESQAAAIAVGQDVVAGSFVCFGAG